MKILIGGWTYYFSDIIRFKVSAVIFVLNLTNQMDCLLIHHGRLQHYVHTDQSQPGSEESHQGGSHQVIAYNNDDVPIVVIPI